jgi:hypothetical protein
MRATAFTRSITNAESPQRCCILRCRRSGGCDTRPAVMINRDAQWRDKMVTVNVQVDETRRHNFPEAS